MIGGSNHSLNKSNKVIGKTEGGDDAAFYKKTILEDNSDTGYCLRTAAEEGDTHYACRGLDARTTRAIRVLMHGAMLLGYAIGGAGWWAGFGAAANPSYLKVADVDGPAAHLTEHLQQNLAILRELLDKSDEQLALLLHTAILTAGGQDPMKDPPAPSDGADTKEKAVDDTSAAAAAAAKPVHPGANDLGAVVTLSEGHAACHDAAKGPLAVGAPGRVVECGRSGRLLVQVLDGGGDKWWYDQEALVVAAAGAAARAGGGGKADGGGHPLEPSAGSNQIGLRVVLAPGFEGVHDAAGGPLVVGQVGEVVQVSVSQQRDMSY